MSQLYERIGRHENVTMIVNFLSQFERITSQQIHINSDFSMDDNIFMHAVREGPAPKHIFNS